MQNRDDAILKHIGSYHLSLRAIIERLSFEGRSADHVIQRLLEEGRIQAFPLPGGLSYYQLTLTEARSRGIPENRARSRSGGALRRALALLWFCCMTDQRRYKIERNALTNLFGKAKGLGKPHCWELGLEKRKHIYRIYTPGPHADEREIVRSLLIDAEHALAHPAMGRFVVEGFFSFAVLM